LVSLHLPKTAGESFYASLDEYYKGRVLRDYADLPINTPPLQRNTTALIKCVFNNFQDYRKYDCVHGHFLPVKYLLYSHIAKNVKFITWMRDPIERLASHYYFWIRSYNSKNAHPLRKRVVEEKWSLERFCLSTELRNFYSQFLWAFPLKRFDFIGITEYYETEIEYFSKEFLGHSLNVHRKNINPRKETTSYFAENLPLKEEIINYHSQDVKLYNWALNLRLTQRSQKPSGRESD